MLKVRLNKKWLTFAEGSIIERSDEEALWLERTKIGKVIKKAGRPPKIKTEAKAEKVEA